MGEGDILRCIQQYGATKHLIAKSMLPSRSSIQSQETRRSLLQRGSIA